MIITCQVKKYLIECNYLKGDIHLAGKIKFIGGH